MIEVIWMNATDKKFIEKVLDLINQANEIMTQLQQDHQDRIDNMPESLQSSDKYQEMEEKQSQLEDIQSTLEQLEYDLNDLLGY
jgi:hypothetical protein